MEVGSALWISKISYTSISGDGFKFNIGIRGFDDFPVHALEICRYTTVSKELHLGKQNQLFYGVKHCHRNGNIYVTDTVILIFGSKHFW